ncbi:hypothetical protein QBC39DRAFT_369022 [Podospora conica]|nr:hypothetical protein QBC39DRAFT_369022 [Schizothecium conicum]
MPPKKEDQADAALRVIQAFIKDPVINHFSTLDKENARLIEENNRKTIFQEQQEKRLVELLDLSKHAKTRADDLGRQLATQQKSNKDLADANAATRRQLNAVQDAHKDVSRRLERLESFSVRMLPTSECKGLDALYNKARDFAESVFGVDFPEEIIKNSGLWEGFKDHKWCKGITVIRDNTQVAKQMRVAAALAILSRELSASIFQATYSLGESGELSALLNQIADETPEVECYLRSVLLAATPKFVYDENGEEWARKAVEHLMAIMKPLFRKGSAQEKLQHGLEDVCDQALTVWRIAQQVEGRIVVDFELGYDDGEMQPQTLDFKLATLSEPVGRKPQQNGGPYPPQANGGQANGTGKKAQNKPPPVETSPPDPYVVVWPEFYAITNDQTDVLSPARVVSQAQLKEAKKEELNNHSKRASRQVQRRRTMSKSESVGSPGGSNGDVSASSPTTSKSFLPQRGGGGHAND